MCKFSRDGEMFLVFPCAWTLNLLRTIVQNAMSSFDSETKLKNFELGSSDNCLELVKYRQVDYTLFALL